MDTADSRARDCTDPSKGDLLLDYALHRLEGEPATDFEAHLLECDVCYENFRAVVRTSEYLGTILERGPASLPPVFRFLRQRSRSKWLKRSLLALLLIGLGLLAGLLFDGFGRSKRSSDLGGRPNGAGAQVAQAEPVTGQVPLPD